MARVSAEALETTVPRVREPGTRAATDVPVAEKEREARTVVPVPADPRLIREALKKLVAEPAWEAVGIIWTDRT
jgi:hypothetical protein